jgi:hypothetical protein
MHMLTQRSGHAVLSAGAGASARAWVALAGGGSRRQRVRAAALGAGAAAALAVANRAGLGPVEADLSGASLRRGGLRGIREALRRLEVGAPHVLWGHSHRSGPWPGDDLAEWTTAAGGRLHNTGSWVYEPHFLSPTANASPYWPGTAVLVEDDPAVPPRLVRLLGDRGHEALRPGRPAAALRPVRA